jgi:outer membrane usher protein
MTDKLTLEAGTSAQQSGLVGLLGGGAASMPGWGLGTLALGISHGDAGTGAQIALGWERRTRHHGFALRSQLASYDYRQTGVDAEQTVRRLDSAFYSYQLPGIGSLGLSWTQQQRIGADALSITTASFSTRQTAWGSLIFSLSHLKADTDTSSFNVYWSYNLGGFTSVSAQHADTSNGPSRQIVQLQKSLPAGEGWGYRLQVAQRAAQQAALYAQNDYGRVRIEAAELNGQTRERFGLSGAIATLDGQWFLSRRIDSSFGVARVPGFAKVRIYVDNQLAARTNADGYALLPRLYPYMRNNISVEPLDLPLDTEIGQLKVRPVPAWRSGVMIDIPIRKVSAATLNLIRDDESPVPAGATVDLLDDDETVIESFGVGHEGLLYLSGLRSQNQLRAHWAGGMCTARIPFQPEPGSIPYLGQYRCQQSQAQ